MENNHNDDNNLADARRQPILLTPEGQQLFSLLESYVKQELPPLTSSKMNEMVNSMAAGEAGGELVPTIRKSIVACLFGRDNNNRIITDEQRGLTTTIVDTEEWPKEEKRIETALRLFPGILLEQFLGYYPIQWLAMKEADGTYNLKNISLLPVVTRLGFELQQFDAASRGGLLVQHPTGWNALKKIICYYTMGNENNELRDDCFSIVRNLMRDNNLLVTEDIQQHNLVGIMCTHLKHCSEDNLRYLINMDPVTLSLPCDPEKGNMLPIHYSPLHDIQVFRFLLAAGMKYYPEKLGFVFCDGTYRNSDGNLGQWTPYQQACKDFGQEKVNHEVINYIKEYYCTSTSTSAGTNNNNNNNNTATSLLLSAITDASIHVDGVYILFRDNPQAALLRLQEAARAVVVVVREEIKTGTDFDINISNKNSTSATATATATASNNNNADTSSSILKTDIVVAASVIVVGSSTATNNNNNNDDDDDDNHTDGDNGNVTQHQPLLASSSSLKGTKRKHEMVSNRS